MAVIRVEKTSNYTVMSNHHLRNKNLSLKAKGLISLMLSLPPNWDYSVAGLAAICKEGMTSIRSTLKEMEENRYLVRKRVNSEKGYFVYEYILYEIPEEPYTENTHTVNTHTDNLHTDSAYMGNDTQLSKDKVIKEKRIKEELRKEETNKEAVSVYDEILEEIEDEELKQLYRDYIDMRNTIKSPVSKRTLSMLVDRCARMANFDLNLQKEMIEAAVINNWKSVYLPDAKEKKKKDDSGGRIYNREQRYGKDGYDALKNSSFYNK